MTKYINKIALILACAMIGSAAYSAFAAKCDAKADECLTEGQQTATCDFDTEGKRCDNNDSCDCETVNLLGNHCKCVLKS